MLSTCNHTQHGHISKKTHRQYTQKYTVHLMDHAIKFTMVGVSVKIIIKVKTPLKYKLTMKINK